MQRNNLEYKFTLETKVSLQQNTACLYSGGGRKEEGGRRRKEGGGALSSPPSRSPSRRATLDLGFLAPGMCPEYVSCVHTPQKNGRMPTGREKGSFVKVTRNKMAHKSNPIIMKVQGNPSFLCYKNVGTLHISQNKSGAEPWNSYYTRGCGRGWVGFCFLFS